MDIEVNTLAQIKAETGRDLDNQVDENTLVSGEKSNGTFGVFKLFAAIKNCIDNWITTIAGNKNFTGAVTINSKAVATTEAVNNALANLNTITYETITDANVIPETTKSILNRCSPTANNIPDSIHGWYITTTRTGNYITQIATNSGATTTSASTDVLTYRRTGFYTNNAWTWTSWEKLITENDISYNRPTFNCPRGGSFSIEYLLKQKVNSIHHYFGKVTMGNDATGGNIFINVDGLSNGNGWEVVGRWYIPDTDYNGMLFCIGNTSIWLQKGYTTGGTRINSTEIQGKTVFFDFTAFKGGVSTLSE